jgi:hypothetical protein
LVQHLQDCVTVFDCLQALLEGKRLAGRLRHEAARENQATGGQSNQRSHAILYSSVHFNSLLLAALQVKPAAF